MLLLCWDLLIILPSTVPAMPHVRLGLEHLASFVTRMFGPNNCQHCTCRSIWHVVKRMNLYPHQMTSFLNRSPYELSATFTERWDYAMRRQGTASSGLNWLLCPKNTETSNVVSLSSTAFYLTLLLLPLPRKMTVALRGPKWSFSQLSP